MHQEVLIILYYTIFNGCVGIYIIYQVTMRMKENILSRVLKYWGRNSIKILCCHGFIIQVIRLLDYKLLDNFLPGLGFFEGVVLTSLTMMVLTGAMPLINRFLNWSFGIKNVQHRNV